MWLKRTLPSGAKVMIADDLGPEDLAMVQALYSRRADSAETHLLRLRRDARPTASERAGSFMARYYVGYGHKSIADCGSTTLFFEGVSMLAAKAIQDWPLYSGQETSTRYMDMAARPVADPIGTPASRAIADQWMSFYREGMPRAREEVLRRYPRRDGEDGETYERAVSARAFDVMRAFLPAGCTTQLSWHTNLRQAGDHLAWLAAHPLAEVAGLAAAATDLLREAYPSSFSPEGPGAMLSGVGRRGAPAEPRERWLRDVGGRWAYLNPDWPCGAPDWGTTDEHEAPFATTISNRDLSSYRHVLQKRPRGCVLPHWMSDLGQVTFRRSLDFGSFRDVQRHRNGVCRMPLLRPFTEFEEWYCAQLDREHADEARDLVARQERAIAALDARPVDEQYLTAMGFRVPCRLTYALPAAAYVLELRSGRAVHPTLRAAVRQMAEDFQRAHPDVTLHLDLSASDWDLRRGKQTIAERT